MPIVRNCPGRVGRRFANGAGPGDRVGACRRHAGGDRRRVGGGWHDPAGPVHGGPGPVPGRAHGPGARLVRGGPPGPGGPRARAALPAHAGLRAGVGLRVHAGHARVRASHCGRRTGVQNSRAVGPPGSHTPEAGCRRYKRAAHTHRSRWAVACSKGRQEPRRSPWPVRQAQRQKQCGQAGDVSWWSDSGVAHGVPPIA